MRQLRVGHKAPLPHPALPRPPGRGSRKLVRCLHLKAGQLLDADATDPQPLFLIAEQLLNPVGKTAIHQVVVNPPGYLWYTCRSRTSRSNPSGRAVRDQFKCYPGEAGRQRFYGLACLFCRQGVVYRLDFDLTSGTAISIRSILGAKTPLIGLANSIVFLPAGSLTSTTLVW